MTERDENTDELAQRVEQLENRVESQQETIRKLMPDRRTLLKGGATAGAAALLGFGSGSATASTGTAGQIGTQSDRPDIYADVVNTGSATINGNTAGGYPTSSGSISATLGGGFTTEDADRPVDIYLIINAETDGSTNGDVRVDIDFSGGTSTDVSLQCIADSTAGAGYVETESFEFTLPPGAQYRIRNNSDPNNNNLINASTKLTR